MRSLETTERHVLVNDHEIVCGDYHGMSKQTSENGPQARSLHN